MEYSTKTPKVNAIELPRVNFPFVIVEDLPPDQANDYLEYLRKNAETCAVLPEYPNKICSYYWDYENWYDCWIVGKEAKSFD